MILTGTCIDAVLPSGLLPQQTILVLARKGPCEENLLVWVSQLVKNLEENYEVRRPGDTDWPEVYPIVFVGSVHDSLARPTKQLTDISQPHKTWLDQAVFLLCARVLHGRPEDVAGTSLEMTAPIIIEFDIGRGGAGEVRVKRNDLAPKTVGWAMPFSDQPTPPPKPPSSIWDLIGDDDD